MPEYRVRASLHTTLAGARGYDDPRPALKHEECDGVSFNLLQATPYRLSPRGLGPAPGGRRAHAGDHGPRRALPAAAAPSVAAPDATADVAAPRGHSHATHDPTVARRDAREPAKGLAKAAALNAVARKLAKVAWSIVTHGTISDPKRVDTQLSDDHPLENQPENLGPHPPAGSVAGPRDDRLRLAADCKKLKDTFDDWERFRKPHPLGWGSVG